MDKSLCKLPPLLLEYLQKEAFVIVSPSPNIPTLSHSDRRPRIVFFGPVVEVFLCLSVLRC